MINTWYDFAWSPMVGCENGCDYCEVRDKHEDLHYDRLRGKHVPEDYKNPFKVPTFFPNRLEQPFEMIMPFAPFSRNKMAAEISPDKAIVMVVPFGDLMTPSSENDWIHSIIRVCMDNPQLVFAFLTQFPERYLLFHFPENCWLGITLDYAYNYQRVGRLKINKNNKKYVCIEPLMGVMSHVNFSEIDFIIMGAMNDPLYYAEQKWIHSINHSKIYYKESMDKFLIPNIYSSAIGHGRNFNSVI